VPTGNPENITNRATSAVPDAFSSVFLGGTFAYCGIDTTLA
jgi:hypothetical protein